MSIIRERDSTGAIIHNDPMVGIDFVCYRCKAPVGQVRMSTLEGSDRSLLFRAGADGTLPLEAGRPEGQAKLLLGCRRCGSDTQYSATRAEQALNGVWAVNRDQVWELPV